MLKIALSVAATLAFGQSATSSAPSGPGIIDIAYVGAQDHIIPTIVIARHGNTLFYEKDFGGGIRMMAYYFDDFFTRNEVDVVEVDDDVFAVARRITETVQCTARRENTFGFGGTLATVRVPTNAVAFRCGMTRAMACTYIGKLRSAFATRALPIAAFDRRLREIECGKAG